MKRTGSVAFLSGFLFAIGLAVSGMTHPSKVLGFLDVFGAWDPSLACVMGGGLIVNIVAFRWILRRRAPLFASAFAMPSNREVDPKLVLGAALFGIGWGLGGFCPGPALVSVVTGALPIALFVVAMLASMAIYDWVRMAVGAEARAPQPEV